MPHPEKCGIWLHSIKQLEEFQWARTKKQRSSFKSATQMNKINQELPASRISRLNVLELFKGMARLDQHKLAAYIMQIGWLNIRLMAMEDIADWESENFELQLAPHTSMKWKWKSSTPASYVPSATTRERASCKSNSTRATHCNTAAWASRFSSSSAAWGFYRANMEEVVRWKKFKGLYPRGATDEHKTNHWAVLYL